MSDPQLLTLALQVLRHLFVDVFEHGRGAWNLATGEGAVLFGLFLRGNHFSFKFSADGAVLFLRPVTDLDQVLFQTRDRIAEREVAPVIGRAVFRWVVGSRVRPGATSARP